MLTHFPSCTFSRWVSSQGRWHSHREAGYMGRTRILECIPDASWGWAQSHHPGLSLVTIRSQHGPGTSEQQVLAQKEKQPGPLLCFLQRKVIALGDTQGRGQRGICRCGPGCSSSIAPQRLAFLLLFNENKPRSFLFAVPRLLSCH